MNSHKLRRPNVNPFQKLVQEGDMADAAQEWQLIDWNEEDEIYIVL